MNDPNNPENRYYSYSGAYAADMMAYPHQLKTTRMTQPQIDLINKITQEISWWKESKEVSWKMIQDFVVHKMPDMHHEDQALIQNGLSHIMSVIKRTV